MEISSQLGKGCIGGSKNGKKVVVDSFNLDNILVPL